MFSAARISTIRKSKGLSQEVLAEQSGVSLRTIQRVEQGDTTPRGYTLQALATALEVPLDAFRLPPEVAPMLVKPAGPAAAVAVPMSPQPDAQLVQLLNLSALGFLLFPLLNLVGPWILWRRYRRRVEHAAEVGRRVLGFQVLWQVGCFVAYGLAVAGNLLARRFQVDIPNPFIGVFVISYLLNLLTICYAGWQLRKGRLDIYPIRL